MSLPLSELRKQLRGPRGLRMPVWMGEARRGNFQPGTPRIPQRAFTSSEFARIYMAMKLGNIMFLTFILLWPAKSGLAEAVIEGRVELPKTHHAPVVNQRYEIISKGGVIAPNPPVAVVYLEG